MALLEIKGLTKRFKGLRAVHEVSFSIDGNEIFGLIGPNGSGKTTIFNMVSGVFAPSEGDIHFDGKNITGMQPHVICGRGIGRTFQIAKPFLKLSVLENCIIGALSRTSSVDVAGKKSKAVLEQLGISHLAGSMGKDLTVPQRKRLELARALSTEPKILLLDEVMAGLRPTEVNEMLKVLRDIANTGIALFIIEHIMHVIMNISDTVMVLNHGERIAMGRPDQVVRDANVVEAYLGEEYSLA
jgi:branched-chain amino acid transport system ATP-binding protein